MRYVSLAGNWLLEALLQLKPRKESKDRFLKRCAKMLQRQGAIDGELIRGILRTGTKAKVPLFVVALLAKEVGCSVRRLLYGPGEVNFDDPNLDTEADTTEIASANNFATLLEAFHVDFPSILWEYAFPAHRMGTMSEIPLEGWIELYRERFGSNPPPRHQTT
jgi:hypothetical protein